MSDHFPLNLGALYLNGLLSKEQEERRQGWEQRGRLRGGSVGLLLPDGTPIGGGCPRAAYARFLGAEPPRDSLKWAYTHLMLDGGNLSEDLWAEDMRRGLLATPGLPDGARVLQEQDFPIEWFSPDPRRPGHSVRATGREDIIVVDGFGSPYLFGEMKHVSSLTTAVPVLLGRKPKLEHAVQSANYSLRCGVPVQLWYVLRVKLPFASWTWLDPYRYGAPDGYEPRLEPFLERTGKTGRSKVKQVLPFLMGFQIEWGEDGHVWIQALLPDGPLGQPWSTPITAEGIDSFYTSILEQEAKRRLHPLRPVAAEANGDVHGRFDPCNWCSWKETCDRFEPRLHATDEEQTAAFDGWKDAVMDEAAKGKALSEAAVEPAPTILPKAE